MDNHSFCSSGIRKATKQRLVVVCRKLKEVVPVCSTAISFTANAAQHPGKGCEDTETKIFVEEFVKSILIATEDLGRYVPAVVGAIACSCFVNPGRSADSQRHWQALQNVVEVLQSMATSLQAMAQEQSINLARAAKGKRIQSR